MIKTKTAYACKVPKSISGEKGSRCNSGATAITVFCVKQTHPPLNSRFEKARLQNVVHTISQETCLVSHNSLFLGKGRTEDWIALTHRAFACFCMFRSGNVQFFYIDGGTRTK